MDQKVKQAFRTWQLFAAEFNKKGWAFLRREGVARFGGGYDTGSLSATQDSRVVTLSGGTFPSSCVGWRIGPTISETEIYKVASRDSDTQVTLDRPYEGETKSGMDYVMYDPYGTLPADYSMTEVAVLEAGGRKVGDAKFDEPRTTWPKPLLFGNAYVKMHAEPTTTARQSSSTVTIAEADATVTLAAGSWPEWIVDRFLRFGNETALYKVASRTSDTVVELDRNYGGVNAGSGVAYELDPAGCYRVELMHPQEDQCALKIQYFCVPREPVNDTDLLEGDEKFAYAVADIAAADVIDGLPGVEREMYAAKSTRLNNRGLQMLEAMMTGGPEPQQTAAIRDIRYEGRRIPGA